MLYVLMSVLCSVTVSVILKLTRRYEIDTLQVIVWNYPVAMLCSALFLQPQWPSGGTLPWALYIALAVLLPGIFLALGASIRHAGIVRTEVAQRLSLFISLLAAFWLFGESAKPGKLVGVAIGVAAILCSIGWHRQPTDAVVTSRPWPYPLIVFFGYGVIDVLFKRMAQYTDVSYTTSMLIAFILATTVAFLLLICRIAVSRRPFSIKAIGWGLILGIFNFANILFYMRAHRTLPDNPSIVFTGMNVGVITLGAFAGLILFREKLSLVNKIGIILAIMSIFIIAYL